MGIVAGQVHDTFVDDRDASDSGPRRDRSRARGQQNYSVAEPASIVLLGAGLVGLGLYAKLKRGKNR